MRLLWLKTELLHPVDKGGKIRTYQTLRQIKRNHHVTYLTLDDGAGGRAAEDAAHEYCHELVTVPHATHAKFSAGFYADLIGNAFSRLPYAIAKYRSAAMQEEIASHLTGNRFDVLVCDFLTPAINLPRALPCPTVLFQHNVEATIWRRHAETQRSLPARLYLRDQWKRMQKFEGAACRRFDLVVAVSPTDRDQLIEDYRLTHVVDVPTGVDTDYFTADHTPASGARNLLFTGSMDWLPNVDAIAMFVEDVLPRIRAQLPDVTVTVVGRNPHPSLLELSRRDPAIKVTGYVDDIRPFFADAGAYIVPIRIGGGTRLKIFEAMSMGTPIVSTTVGAEGLPVEDGGDIVLADAPDAFAAAVVKVLAEPAFSQAIAARAATKVRAEWGWDKAAARFIAACEQARALHERSDSQPTRSVSRERGNDVRVPLASRDP